jgi:hypothetical protein
MPKRSSKKPRLPDPNELAFSIVQAVTGEPPPPAPTDPPAGRKNPAAVTLGRLGGLKGGPARAKKLGKKKLSEAAKKAAEARWAKQRQTQS